ncbi:MAG: hypothetical protein Q8P22_08295 [Chloroflexota bacterium]|nr:hypothetical protein [Chloroflexota bacterium]
MLWQVRNFARAIIKTNLIITRTFLDEVIKRLGPLPPPESSSPAQDSATAAPPEEPPAAEAAEEVAPPPSKAPAEEGESFGRPGAEPEQR